MDPDHQEGVRRTVEMVEGVFRLVALTGKRKRGAYRRVNLARTDIAARSSRLRLARAFIAEGVRTDSSSHIAMLHIGSAVGVMWADTPPSYNELSVFMARTKRS
jgi:hypothetical protein